MPTMKKHFVTFQSPGTLFPETNELEIDSWDVEKAKEMARTISQRHGARPFGFRFHTLTRKDNEFEPKKTKSSCFYWLGGRVETLKEIEVRNDPKEQILISNMRGNGWDRVIVNDNSYRFTSHLDDGDVILDWSREEFEKKNSKKSGKRAARSE